MSDKTRKTIEIPEITRIEGHASVHIDIENGQVSNVEMEVFEGTRFFERLVLGHQFYEIPHITSRVCAICSTGHILAAIFAEEAIIGFQQPQRLRLFRELMHLGMIIESHSTHIFALALPDFVGAKDLVDFATKHNAQFQAWTKLRSLGALIQTTVGGRPFHPVNLQMGGLSHYPHVSDLLPLKNKISECWSLALNVAQLLLGFKPPLKRTSVPAFLALIPDTPEYGYFGRTIRSTQGWEAPIDQYKEYLAEKTVHYSHAKRTTARGADMMVGSMARLCLFGDRLTDEAKNVYRQSPLSAGDTNSIWNNLAQAIEVIQALDRASDIIDALSKEQGDEPKPLLTRQSGGSGVGAVECPRGTLYHAYSIDDQGTITAADMITPSVQNSGRIELDIREAVSAASNPTDPGLSTGLETLVRAYDPCNTCATHMVRVRYI